MSHLKGCLGLLLLGVVIAILIKIHSFTWPVWLYLVIAIILYGLCEKSKTIFAKAGKSTLIPIIIGLSTLFILLIVFNATTADESTISSTEKVIVRADKDLPLWTKIPWYVVLCILLLIMAITWYIPKAGLVTKYATLNKNVTVGVAAVATLASFSFFSDACLVRPNAINIYKKLTAIYVGSKKQEEAEKSEYLALMSIKYAMERLSYADKNYYSGAFQVFVQVHYPKTGAEAAGHFIGDRLTEGMPYFQVLPPPPTPGPIDLAKSKTPLEVASAQVARTEKAAATTTKLKAEVIESISTAFDLGKDPIKDAIVEGMVARLSSQFAEMAKSLIGNIADVGIEKLAKPYIDKGADYLLHILQRNNVTHAGSVLASQQQGELLLGEFKTSISTQCTAEANQLKSITSELKQTMNVDADKTGALIDEYNQIKKQLLTNADIFKASGPVSILDAAGESAELRILSAVAEMEETVKIAREAQLALEGLRDLKAASTVIRDLPR